MSLKTLPLFLVLVAMATLLPAESAPGWPLSADKRGGADAAWMQDLADAEGVAVQKRISPACGNDCFSCGKRFITSAYSQVSCLDACTVIPNHRDRDCQEHRIG